MGVQRRVAFAVVLCGVLLTQGAHAEPGVCKITAGTSGTFKFVTLKCALQSSPQNYEIRSTRWEHQDQEGYRELARFAGRTFTCELTRTTNELGYMAQTEHYSVDNCK